MQHLNQKPRLQRGVILLPTRSTAFCIPLSAFLDGVDIPMRSVDEDDIPTVKLQPNDQTPESVPMPDPKRDESNDEHTVEVHIISEPPPPPSVLEAFINAHRKAGFRIGPGVRRTTVSSRTQETPFFAWWIVELSAAIGGRM